MAIILNVVAIYQFILSRVYFDAGLNRLTTHGLVEPL